MCCRRRAPCAGGGHEGARPRHCAVIGGAHGEPPRHRRERADVRGKAASTRNENKAGDTPCAMNRKSSRSSVAAPTVPLTVGRVRKRKKSLFISALFIQIYLLRSVIFFKILLWAIFLFIPARRHTVWVGALQAERGLSTAALRVPREGRQPNEPAPPLDEPCAASGYLGHFQLRRASRPPNRLGGQPGAASARAVRTAPLRGPRGPAAPHSAPPAS